MNYRLHPICAGIVLVLFVLTSCSTVKIDQEYQDSFSGLAEYYAGKGISQFTSTLPRVYLNGISWFNRILELVESAEDYILIDTFLSNTCLENQEIYDALKIKHKEGVRIYFLCDSSSFIQPYLIKDGFAPAAIAFLQSAGIPVTEYNPYLGTRLGILTKMLDRDHRKFVIIDGKTLVLGGTNLNFASLTIPDGKGHIDSMTEIDSSGAVAQMLNSFIRSWNAYSIEKLSVEDFVVRESDGDSALWLFDQGTGDHGVVATMFDGLFASAVHEIWMIQAFAFLTGKLLEKIRQLEERGVDVHIVFSNNYQGIQYEKAAMYNILKLLDTGADAYMLESPDGSFAHIKFVAVDDSVVSLGSANYNLRSFDLSRETSFVSADPRLVQSSWDWFSKILSQCRPITREEAEGYRSFSYLFYYLLMLYGG